MRKGRPHYEVIVSGGGLVGLTLGVALASAGVRVLVVDAQTPSQVLSEPFDGRASAIARGSQRVLEGIGHWQHLGGAAAPILDIRVSDGKVGKPASRLFLHYDSQEAGGGPLGFIVENRTLRRGLHRRASELDRLDLLAPARVTGVERSVTGVEVALSDGTRRSGLLVVAAEGRQSPLREAAGIPVTRWTYPQSGIVATIVHERPHHGVAHEHFLPSGPFAMLPLPDDEAGRHRSSIVWTERHRLAEAVKELDDTAFAAEVARRFGDTLGHLQVEGRRWCYPLSLMHASRYGGDRLVLVGDSAHVIHPIAGQGFNLGIRDVAALAECIVDSRRLGLDPGSDEVIARYERWRRVDNLTLIAVTDGLNRLFSNDFPPLRLARDLGLSAVQHLPPLKRLFMRHAMGMVGDLPRLVRGEPL